MSAFISAHAGHADWAIAFASCREQVVRQLQQGQNPNLGWCYLSDYYAEAAASILAALRDAMPGLHWVGAVGVGVGAGAVEYFDEPAMALMLAELPPESFKVFSSLETVEAGSGFEPFAALVHAIGVADAAAQLKALSERMASGYLFGGLSSSRSQALCLADDVQAEGLSGVAFNSDVTIVSRVTQGCLPIGPQRVITRAEGNLLVTLDGARAMDCVLEDLGLDSDLSDQELNSALAATLAGLVATSEDASAKPGQFGANTEVRHIVGVGRKSGVLAIAETLENGMRLAFCQRNAVAAQQDLLRIVGEVRAQAEAAGGMRGALYISCSGRGGPHFGARHAEFKMVREALGDIPLIGFFAGGEIARHHLYGYTGVLTVFAGPA
ncbi:FIST signal transduction protein [Rhodoblastus sp.]|uniref:FIST signal transduction protein n=1 Tax=Rhodoblastus sp. TaxID=1962975 RepID=UPI003F9DD5CF